MVMAKTQAEMQGEGSLAFARNPSYGAARFISLIASTISLKRPVIYP
jgi:hypothetical protein